MPEKSDYMIKRLLYLAGFAALEKPENQGRLVFIQHDVTPGRLGHGNKYTSLPEIFPQLNDRKYDTSPGTKLRAYMQSILRALHPEMNTKDFERNWNQLLDHDTGFNNKGEAGSSFQNRYCGGAYFMTTGRTRLRFLEKLTGVYAIDTKKAFPTITPPWLTFQPVINTTIPVHGSTMTKKIPFPQFNSNIRLPLLADGGVAWVRNATLLPDNEIPSPFFL